MALRNGSALLGALAIAGLAHAAPASAQCIELRPSRISVRYVSIGSTSLRLMQG